jgi:hypothetical protein
MWFILWSHENLSRAGLQIHVFYYYYYKPLVFNATFSSPYILIFRERLRNYNYENLAWHGKSQEQKLTYHLEKGNYTWFKD